jgi:hypothetical protein
MIGWFKFAMIREGRRGEDWDGMGGSLHAKY